MPSRNAMIESHRGGGQNSSSFRGMSAASTTSSSSELRRPRTVPDLISYGCLAVRSPEDLPRVPPKLLLNVTMQGSLGPVQVVMTPESTVRDLVAAAVRQYVKEGRRPVVQTTDPSAFDLHYSQFSLESLERGEKLKELGSRNFFLCPRNRSSVVRVGGAAGNGGSANTASFASCSKEFLLSHSQNPTQTPLAASCFLSASLMEFWGVEVKAGEPVKVDPTEFDAYIHLSQAALGEAKKDKGAEPVLLYLKFADQKLVLGTLSRENFPQISFDLVLEKEFELSHNSKTGSVFFYSEEDEDEELPVITKDNGKPDTKNEVAKVIAAKSNAAKANDSKKQVKDLMDADDSDEDDSESDEEDEETPKKAVQGKKRANDSAAKTPVSAKKAKAETPQKTDAKKGGHTATPHPMKKGGKSPNSDAKSGGLSCKSCNKSFNSESGLQQHNKAKHGQ
ncbi:histone deacetylase HDT1-like [Senna tora]|uniref:Histone deacetylase HDT1-like n=1 Tax=Senna tora TaxID=362788 RepID=A0A834WNE4_9FABA|nr:histone deacetylase HDT1-like [Senna tora]